MVGKNGNDDIVNKIYGLHFFQVGWARSDCHPGLMLGADDSTWAFDGYNVCNSDFQKNVIKLMGLI